MKFAERMKFLRKENNYTMKQVAQECGVSYPTYIGYENGVREPGISFLVRAAEYLGASVEYLLGLVDEPNIAPARQMGAADAAQNGGQNLALENDKGTGARNSRSSRRSGVHNKRGSQFGSDNEKNDQQIYYQRKIVTESAYNAEESKESSSPDCKMMHPVTLGEYIRQKRTYLGLSQMQLSNLSGVKDEDIDQLEADKQIEASPEILEKLAPHLSTSYIQLLYLAGQIEGSSDAKIDHGSANSDDHLSEIERILEKDKEFLSLLGEVFENASPEEIQVLTIILKKLANKNMSIQDRNTLCGILSKF